MSRTTGTRLTRFGACVLSIMVQNGIREIAALSDELAANGYDFKPARISNWLYGRHSADPLFPSALASTLGLGEEQRGRLAYEFTYGQRVAILELA